MPFRIASNGVGRAPHAREIYGKPSPRLFLMEGWPKIARVRCTSAVWVLLLCLLTRAGAGIGRNAVPATRGGEIEQWEKADCAHHVRKWGSLLGIPGGVDGDGCERTVSRDPAESVRVRMGGFGGLLGAWERTGSVDREWLRGGAWSSDDADEKRRTYAPSARIDHALWRSLRSVPMGTLICSSQLVGT